MNRARRPAPAPGWHVPEPDTASDAGEPDGLSPRHTVAQAMRLLCSPAGIAGGLTELAWVGAHALLYPLGTRSDGVRPDDRNRPGEQSAAARALFADDPLAARIPVVMVHGFVDNHSIFTLMRRSLRRRGFTSVCSWNYSPLLQDVRAAAEELGRHLEEVCASTGHDRVHVVGHSLGGLIARYHVQCQGGSDRVASLVTLGTPHSGTVWAHLLPAPLVRQLRPGSALLAELDAPNDDCSTEITAVYSDLDQVVVPARSGRCDHPDLRARNVLVRGVGHLSLPVHRAVLDEVAATLAGRRRIAAAPVAETVAVA